MGTKEIIFIIIASIVGFILLISLLLSIILIFPRKMEHEPAMINEEKKGWMKIKWFNEIEKEKVSIKSPYGYKLYVELMKNSKKTNKTIIIVHGYHFNLIGSVKYGEMFLRLGYNVVWYDNCKNGNSGGKMTTMGYKEKDDLGTVVDFVKEKWGKDQLIELHGVSMVASTCLMYGAGTEKGDIRFIIEDCGYSSLEEEIRYKLKEFHLPKQPFLALMKFFVRLIGRFSFCDVNPKCLLEQDTSLDDIPILFVHGDADKFTPTSMVYEMYERKKGIKELYICKGAGHAESFGTDMKLYENTVLTFLNETIKF